MKLVSPLYGNLQLTQVVRNSTNECLFDPPQNCHLNVKIAKNLSFFQKNCQNYLFSLFWEKRLFLAIKKKVKFWEIFGQSNWQFSGCSGYNHVKQWPFSIIENGNTDQCK